MTLLIDGHISVSLRTGEQRLEIVVVQFLSLVISSPRLWENGICYSFLPRVLPFPFK